MDEKVTSLTHETTVIGLGPTWIGLFEFILC